MQNCPYCGKLTDPKLEACPHCGGSLRKTAPPGQRPGRGRQTCPNCKAMVQEGDIICVVCGTNLLTGQKITEEQRIAPVRDRRIPLLVVGALVLIVLMIMGGLWAYVSTRDPLNQALDLMEKNQFMEAQDVLTAYVERVPDERRALFELGKLQWRNNQYTPAANSFSRVVELDPADVQAAFWAVASLELDQGGAQRPRQITLLEQVVSVEPNNAEAWYLLALAYGTQGNTAKQIEALERVASIVRTNPETKRALAIGLALDGRYAQADEELKTAAALGANPEITAIQGFVANMDARKVEAIERLQESVSQEGLSLRWEALTQLGKLLMEQGRFREAIPLFDEALTLRTTNNDIARYLHAVSLKAIGSFQEALGEFEALTRDSTAYEREATVQVADIHLALGSPDRARATIDRLTPPADGGGAPYHTVRGRILAVTGDDGAQEEFNKAKSADPKYAPAYLEAGLLYVRREALPQGLRELETYLELVGGDSETPQVVQIRELTNQLRQTTSQPNPAAGL